MGVLSNDWRARALPGPFPMLTKSGDRDVAMLCDVPAEFRGLYESGIFEYHAETELEFKDSNMGSKQGNHVLDKKMSKEPKPPGELGGEHEPEPPEIRARSMRKRKQVLNDSDSDGRIQLPTAAILSVRKSGNLVKLTDLDQQEVVVMD